MHRKIRRFAVSVALCALLPGVASATTRQIAEFRPTQLMFDQSVLNQLSYGTYRDPFDELQTRPYNLLFANIGRHPNLSPWQGQEGLYTRYLNALIGNNGTANVDNDADAVQGSMIRRESAKTAWGLSAAFLSGNTGSNDVNGLITFTDIDDLTGYDLRGGLSQMFGDALVAGFGVRVTQAESEVSARTLELGVGGAFGSENFDQFNVSLDAGIRQFLSARSSWDITGELGFGNSEQMMFNDTLDAAGAVTDHFVITNYEIADLDFGVSAGYNRLRENELGETEYRVGVERSSRELDNSDLSFSNSLGLLTPLVTLLGQDPIERTGIHLSAKTIFQAGETELFGGAELGYFMVEGSTQIDDAIAVTIVNETIDDTETHLGLTIGLRQSLIKDRLRFVVSGRADVMDAERNTIFDTTSDAEDGSLTTAQYAIGVEGVLANVTFDLAWLLGEEAAVVPVNIGLPEGSRRSVELDRLIFSAAVSW